MAGIFAYAIMNFSAKKNIAANQHTTKIIADTINALTAQEQADINNQLQNAKTLLAENKKDEALNIYAQLSQQNIPQAMFQYANLALQNKNTNIDCCAGF